MLFPYYILASALVFLSFKSFRGGIAWLRFFRSELAKPLADLAPFATVIAPCKGLDDGLRENLSAVLGQDYPEYEVIFVVDDESDAAVPVIRELIAGRANAELVIAQRSHHSSQKAENLREGVLHASARSEIFVTVDSDARPSPNWLRSLVAALADENTGAATGYRWFISAKGSLASELRSAWNASIASALGPNTRSNFCWGGATAIRREAFDRLGIRERWARTVSDDFTVTRAMNEAGLPIRFVPQALTASIEDCTWRGLFEFTNRQLKITRTYAPHLWLVPFVGSALFVFVIVASVVLLLTRPPGSLPFLAAAATLLLVAGFSMGKSWVRLQAVRLVLKQYDRGLVRQIGYQLVLWAPAQIVFLINCGIALLSRRIVWRGRVYDMRSPDVILVGEMRDLDRG